ncbi:aminoacyl-tRNA hydrolase [Candidatus Woesebacteria bacterium]|nr:aminoacyl-tRNA hydrolase [Candidatus Woesebacteria bacterium]
MKIIIGLGNPEEKHKNNRHNVGFLTVDRVQQAASSECSWQENKKLSAVICKLNVDVILAKPQTFMNASGEAVRALIREFKGKPDQLYVIHDDLDIPIGSYKIQKGKGPKLHYGLDSIDEVLGTSDYWRVRVGVDNRDPENRTRGEQYVLQDFTPEEQETVDEVIDKITEEVKQLIK